MKILLILFIPLIGTIIGAALVFFIKDKLNKNIERLLLGLASGVMVAASIWSLIIPSIDLSLNLAKFSFIPTFIGFSLGTIFLLGMEKFIGKYKENKKKEIMLVGAVTLHNIPEGMSIGVLLTGLLLNNNIISFTGALVLSLGIALQNIPEGAIVSTSLKSKGENEDKAFLSSILTGVVELFFAMITILLTKLVTPILPYFLSFAAGAMMYVVVDDLIPESYNKDSKMGIIGFSIGFLLMMVLDITLG